MADLNDVEQRIAELRAEIEPTLKEIEALESAARVLRALSKGEPVTRSAVLDFSGLTVPQAAEQILLECAPKAMHYKKITEVAFGRGFKGKRTDPNAPRSKVASSFRRMMGQRPDIFEQVGDGMYRLSHEYLTR